MLIQSAHACPVCGFGQDGSQQAYLLTTGIMTFVPLILFGLFVFYLVRKYK